jgi:outer membrane receptor protein involved in Fe transport
LVNALACSSAFAALGGKPVSEVLDGLQSSSLTFIYNSDIVPPSLLVREEPRAQGGVALAEEILQRCGLRLMAVAPGVYAVVAAAPPASSAAPAKAMPLEEVVVQTSRYALASDEMFAVVNDLTRQQIEVLPRLANEPLRAVQRLPGVATNGFSSFGSVRGGANNETTIVFDGLRLYEPFHLKNFLTPVSVLDSQLVDRIEFYSGGFPVNYGDALSGVIDVKTLHPTQPKYFELGLDLFHSSGLASLQLSDNLRGLVAVRRSNLGEIVDLSERDFGEIEYADGLARLDYQLDSATQASVQALLSEDEVSGRRERDTQRITARYRNVYAWTTLEHAWSSRASSRAMLSLTTLENGRHGSVVDPDARIGSVLDERDFQIVGLKLDHQLQTGPVRQRFGGELRWLSGRYDYANAFSFQPDFPFPGSPATATARSSHLRPSGREAAVYADVLADLTSRLSVQGGLRVESQSYGGDDRDTQLSPRLSLLYRATPQTRWRASWGRFSQAQSIDELQVEDGVEMRNAAQVADHTILAVEHSFAPGFDVRVEAYHKNYRTLSPRFENLFSPLVLFPEAEIDRVRIDAQTARAKGVEVLLQVQPTSQWNGWLSYAVARAGDKIAGRYASRGSEQRQSVNFGVTVALRDWTVTLADAFRTGMPTTPLSLLSSPSGPTIDVTQRNTERLGHFNSLDARVVRQIPLSRGKLETFIEVTNALNRRNPCCVDYSVTASDGSLRSSREVDSTLPRVPSLGVSWRFE